MGAMMTKEIGNPSEEDIFRSSEKVIFQGIFKDDQTLNDSEIYSMLMNFRKLNFTKNPSDVTDVINYNEGKEADPFDKIAKYYGRNENPFLFIAMLRSDELSKDIINIISQKCDAEAKEKFIQRMNIYLERISNGEHDAKMFLNDDIDAFFNGYHVECPEHNRNIHANLTINIMPGQALDTGNFFTKKINRMEEEKSELKRVKIFSDGKRILSIEKNEEQQRNYSFTNLATCNMEINWNVKDESGNNLCCDSSLVINSGKVNFGKFTINGENINPKDILQLSKQNKSILIRNKTLHDVYKDLLE